MKNIITQHSFYFTSLPYLVSLLFGLAFSMNAEESVSVTSEEKIFPSFDVISSHTKRVVRVEPAPLPGMLPVAKPVNVTVQVVNDPQLHVEKSTEISPPSAFSFALTARHAQHAEANTILLSASVYDRKFTFLRWFPHGNQAPAMTAWSNVDFSVFQGLSQFESGGKQYSLPFIALENVDSEMRRQAANKKGVEFHEPVFPANLGQEGVHFIVMEGDAADAEAMRPIAVLHELYRTEKARLLADHAARVKAQQEQEAWLRVHPPQPQDVLIRVWKAAPTEENTLEPLSVTPLAETPVKP